MIKKLNNAGNALTKEQMQQVVGGKAANNDCFPWGHPVCCGPCFNGGYVASDGSHGDVSAGNGIYATVFND